MAADFSEFDTTVGGRWRLAGCRDYHSTYEHPFHVSPTGNQHDAIAAVELALAEVEALLGCSLLELVTDPVTGQIHPVTIVTDNGGPFQSFRFEAFIAGHPELAHVRTRVKSPGQNGPRERGCGTGTLTYERPLLDEIDDALKLIKRAEDYRLEHNQTRPHEAIAWNRPKDVHLGLADPTTPTFHTE